MMKKFLLLTAGLTPAALLAAWWLFPGETTAAIVTMAACGLAGLGFVLGSLWTLRLIRTGGQLAGPAQRELQQTETQGVRFLRDMLRVIPSPPQSPEPPPLGLAAADSTVRRRDRGGAG